jgi:hypothetical protein
MRVADALLRLSVVVAVAAAGCGAAAGTPSPGVTPAPTPVATLASTPRPTCYNPNGGECLGPVAAGTYTTVIFQPTLTYTVPDGWQNCEDTPGNFCLIPPGGTLADIDSDVEDFLGVYTQVAANAPGCNEGADPAVGHHPADIAAWASHQAGLATTGLHNVSIGGLSGVVLDISLTPGWTMTCPFAPGVVLSQLITGLDPSGLDHNLTRGVRMRLYLLDFRGGSLAIEVDDLPGGADLAAYDVVVQSFRFSP